MKNADYQDCNEQLLNAGFIFLFGLTLSLTMTQMSLSANLECRDRHDIANNLRKLSSQVPIPTCTLHWPGAKKTLKDTFWGLAY